MSRGPERRGALRPAIAGELTVVLALVLAYDRIRDLAPVHRNAAVDHATSILALEHRLHLAREHEFDQWLVRHHLLAAGASWYYQVLHLMVTLALLTWCYARHPGLYRVARNSLLATSGVALAIFWLYPVAPPRLVPALGFIDPAAIAGIGSVAPTNPYAAMPSLHAGWAVWSAVLAIAMWRSRLARAAWWMYPAVTAAVIVGTANHYLLDVIAGAALAVASWIWTQALARDRQRVRAALSAGHGVKERSLPAAPLLARSVRARSAGPVCPRPGSADPEATGSPGPGWLP